jgi:small subunit ribosomal protein S1
MSKELLKPQQFSKAEHMWDEAEYQLSPEEAQALAQLYEGTFSPYKRGSIVTGTVLSISSDGVLVDINFKSEGLVPLHEFGEHELKKITLGSPIDVILDEFESPDGNVLVSYQKAKALKAWEALMKLYSESKPVEGVVLHKVKGGLSVDIGVPAFLPGSQVDVQRVIDFDQYVGQTITAYILKVNPRRGNVIISRRKYLNEQRSETRKKILDSLEVGAILQGVVKNITNYGAFIDIGGVDGLLHITDMTWGRIAHPTELLRIGDTVTVKVLSFDKANEKVSLGLKQLETNPWEKVSESVQVGSRIKGIISSITDYGLFVEVAKGVEGLVHISEISWSDRITDLHKHFKVGDEIEALVVSLDKDNRRMSLSIKQLEKNPWDTVSEQFTVGQKIKGKVTNVTDFGIFVQLMPGVDGLVHVSDISWTEHIKNPADLYQKGDEIEAVITDINKAKKKISLSLKHLAENPWENLEQKYPVGSMAEGEITRITDSGAFVRLPSGIEGFMHQSEFSEDRDRDQKLEDLLKVGQRSNFRVIKINQDEHKIGLSLKPESSSEEAKRESRTSKKEHRERGSKREENTMPKAKSQLQLELERHAARLQENKPEAGS